MGTLRLRQTLLFVGAVIVPSVVLVALGIRSMRQEEELAEKRTFEESRRAAGLIRQELTTKLESIKLQAAAGRDLPRDGAVAFVARVVGGTLVLPWEESGNQVRAEARQAEAVLQRALGLQKEGQQNAARALNRRMLSMRAADEYGVPFALYAARRLVEGASAEERREIVRCLSQALETPGLSAPAAYLILELLDRLPADAVMRRMAAARAEEMEEIGHLAAEVPRFGHTGADSLWVLFGKSPWLVGMTGKPRDPSRLLIAVRAKPLLDSIKLAEGFRWALDSAAGETLGENLPGLRLAAMPPALRTNSRSREFYLAVLMLVVSVTAFSAWLMSRDARREARLNALRAQFVSSVSHELKTPVSTIRACAELMEMGRVEGGQATSEYLKTIVGESERLTRLVDGVLDFSRIEQGKKTYRFQPVAIEEIVRSAARALEYPLVQGGFALCMNVDRVPPVQGDRLALEQAVTNLLTNAMKYSGDRREIEVNVIRQGARAVIRVQDHGVGIAAEEQVKVFERFYRSPALGGNVPGAGLGLTLVAHVVQAHGGNVTVESKPGDGSVFSILLPIAEGA
ncbi:MAG: HAMP domain-containing histidine kinase [Acidobacteria bacterium]|nr:HAMP domain-containing histidine kinase [Acidobacteriota bacterium]